MALDYREVTIQQAANIIGCSKASVKTMVARGHIGVMRYLTPRSDGRMRKMLSQEDVELVRDQRTFSDFGMKYRGVVVYGTDEILVHAASSSLRIAGFHVHVCATALSALSCVRNDERPILVLCGVDTFSDRQVVAANAGKLDLYGFHKAEELRPLVRWAWARVKDRYENLKDPEYSVDT